MNKLTTFNQNDRTPKKIIMKAEKILENKTGQSIKRWEAIRSMTFERARKIIKKSETELSLQEIKY